MIGRIIDFCARHRWAVIAAYAIAAVFSVLAARRVPLDAIPDLSDAQVIVFTEWRGRSPTLVEDQVTYPIASSLLAAPRVKDVRGYSMPGMSFVYVVFDEGTDPYWARSRVVEYLGGLRDRLPPAATTTLGPDATGVGWVFEYALVDRAGGRDLGELRALQDYTLRYALESVPGVAQVASIGGYEKQWQVTLDPERMRGLGVTFDDVAQAVRRSNGESSGRVVEMSGRESFVRGRGFLRGPADLEEVAVKTTPGGTPTRVRDVGTVRVGAEPRRGLAELGGQGETVGAIVVMRQGENARDVISRVKARLAELERSLPAGVEVVTTYDRSALIDRAIDTLRRALGEEMIVVSAVIALFLLHFRSTLLPVVSLPLAVLLAFVPMWAFGVPATIMSLGGIAIAIGATVDAEIVMVEACHKKLEHAPADLSPRERARLLGEAAKEVTPAIFFSLLIIAISFVPVFGLGGQAGRLFRPLAATKTFVMASAALLSITLAPALRDLLLRGKFHSEDRHPVSRVVRAAYEPFVYVALRRPVTTIAIGVLAILSAVPLAMRLGSEFMPPLDEGDLLYMPTTFPGISIEEAKRQLQRQDAAIAAFPEVATVFGKVGRAETATDPAPLSMVETIVQLKPRSAWPRVTRPRFWSARAPAFARPALARLFPEEGPETHDELVAKLDGALHLPGWTNAFTWPIKTRIDMLATGIRTPVGVKVFGSDVAEIERVGSSLEAVLGRVSGARSVLYERSSGGTYVDIVPRRDALARYGLAVEDLSSVVEGAIGGEPVTTALEGRRRYGVSLRWGEAFRATPEALREVLVSLPGDGARRVALDELAEVKVVEGPPMLKDEAGQLVGYVYVDLDPSRDLGGWVEEAKREVERAEASGEVKLAPGTFVRWTGQWEQLEEMRARMRFLLPLTLLAVVLLLWLQFRNFTEVLIVLASVPFALVGAVWMLYLLDYRVSTAVWVGVIALIGLAAQTGVVMIVYIDHAFVRRLRAGKVRDLDDIIWAHMEGTVQRVRPKLMTVSTMLIGLLPLLWSEGSGADVMKRIAAPMVGGLLTSAFLTLEIIPVVYTYWRWSQVKRAARTGRTVADVCGIDLGDGDEAPPPQALSDARG